jgi:hypothetical protein
MDSAVSQRDSPCRACEWLRSLVSIHRDKIDAGAGHQDSSDQQFDLYAQCYSTPPISIQLENRLQDSFPL